MRYKFNLSAYVQEPLVIGRRGCLGRDLNEETLTDSSSPARKAVAYKSDVSESKEMIVLFYRK